MRSPSTAIIGTLLAALLLCLVPGCGGGSSGLEAVPDTGKPFNINDMPSYDPAQDKSKTQKSTIKR